MKMIPVINDIKLTFLRPDISEIIEVPYFDDGVSAGFPSPADDWQEVKISLDNEVFGNNVSIKFCVRVSGHSMKNAGIEDGDVVVVNKLLEAQSNDICVCVINGEFTLKRLKIESDCVWLLPENDKYPPILVSENEGFQIWGVVTHTLKYHRRK
ncbi:MAG: peptidase S24 [Flavobacterium psychrophilum]|nr:MAG: peptidase S24 [Flavobacterium psychrophilum]